MITAADLRTGSCFELDKEYYRVIQSQLVTAGGQAGPHYNVKLKNLKTGNFTERSFKPTDKLNDADVVIKKIQYVYDEGENIALMDPVTYDQFSYPRKNLGKSAQFLTENCEVDALYLEDQLLGVEVPPIMELTVEQTIAGVSGGQTSSVFKPATLQNGVEILVPPFIKDGDHIRVETHSGTYLERVKEKIKP